jgi:hypothetical protein
MRIISYSLEVLVLSTNVIYTQVNTRTHTQPNLDAGIRGACRRVNLSWVAYYFLTPLNAFVLLFFIAIDSVETCSDSVETP